MTKFPNKPCRHGSYCFAPNCHFAHPPNRIAPTLTDEKCEMGNNCTNLMCADIHPIMAPIEFCPTGSSFKRYCKFQDKCWYRDTCTFIHTTPREEHKAGVGKTPCKIKTPTCRQSSIKIDPCEQKIKTLNRPRSAPTKNVSRIAEFLTKRMMAMQLA